MFVVESERVVDVYWLNFSVKFGDFCSKFNFNFFFFIKWFLWLIVELFLIVVDIEVFYRYFFCSVICSICDLVDGYKGLYSECNVIMIVGIVWIEYYFYC